MTQAELARRAHVSRPWISQFESGKIANPTFDRILTICDVLGVRLGAEYRPINTSDGVGKATNPVAPDALPRGLRQAATMAAAAVSQDAVSAFRSAVSHYEKLIARQNQHAIDNIRQLKLPPINTAADSMVSGSRAGAANKGGER